MYFEMLACGGQLALICLQKESATGCSMSWDRTGSPEQARIENQMLLHREWYTRVRMTLATNISVHEELRMWTE